VPILCSLEKNGISDKPILLFLMKKSGPSSHPPEVHFLNPLIHPGAITDVKSFLERIGRDCDKYIDKFSSWNQLFLMNSKDMEKAGIPTQARKWILNQREAFK
jgi:hypothetical protein